MPMNRRHLLRLAVLMVIPAPVRAPPLRVMTFNVRLLTGNDGVNKWDARRDLVAEMLHAEDPDVIGTQELFKQQGDDIVERLPQFVWFGVGRRGGDEDEHMGVFYQKDRLRVIASGNFWLSDTPDVAGSRTWGNLYPRMVTWARFERIADGATFTFYNTHFPYRDIDEPVRVRCAELIRDRLGKLPASERVILVGDFNTTAGESGPRAPCGLPDRCLGRRPQTQRTGRHLPWLHRQARQTHRLDPVSGTATRIG